MADTQRTRSALLTLFADNVIGDISAQDFRDFVVTVMNAEFVNPGDFWAQPDHQQMTSDTTRGWHMYSQLISEACSFGNILEMTASGAWVLASGIEGSAVSAYSTNKVILGVAADSYAASIFGTILRKGLVYKSAFSASFDANIGKAVHFYSDSPGSITVSNMTSNALILGWVEPTASTGLTDETNVWRFDPNWSIV